MRYLLDTSFIIDHLRDDPGARRAFDRIFEAGDEPFVNEIVVCEAWTGARSGSDPDLTALIRVLEFVQPGPEHVWRAGRWRAEARASGRTLSLPDALIAAAADSLDAVILTRNARDFGLTPVRVETY